MIPEQFVIQNHMVFRNFIRERSSGKHRGKTRTLKSLHKDIKRKELSKYGK